MACCIIVSFYVRADEINKNNDDLYNKPYSSDELKSGRHYLKRETIKMELDDFDNPGMIWVERGKELFSSPLGSKNLSCIECHNSKKDSIIGAVSNFPRFNKKENRLINLEQQINICLEDYMSARPFALESQNLMSLSSYIAFESRGEKMNIKINKVIEPFFKRGKELYFKRIGQMNLACNQCHDHLSGKNLRAEMISQGHANGFPSYLLRWGTISSIHRRFQFCNEQARAEPLEIGHPDYNALQLYVSWRGNGLFIESPSIRR